MRSASFDERDYYFSLLGLNFEVLQDFIWLNSVTVLNKDRQLQTIRRDWATRREVLLLNINREMRALEARRIESVRLYDEGLVAPLLQPELVDNAYREMADEQRRFNNRLLSVDSQIRNYQIRADILSRVIRHCFPDCEVGANPYL